ncbi:unnamed protein product [Allacma fusca]|uniref:Uncharacterized protein n=1 Tax=Allacma fusca TaxID=39272 RepID=A0A8J2NYJ8_9HEXA|nr:unnamed protein product [Allacma fusca]
MSGQLTSRRHVWWSGWYLQTSRQLDSLIRSPQANATSTSQLSPINSKSHNWKVRNKLPDAFHPGVLVVSKEECPEISRKPNIIATCNHHQKTISLANQPQSIGEVTFHQRSSALEKINEWVTIQPLKKAPTKEQNWLKQIVRVLEQHQADFSAD